MEIKIDTLQDLRESYHYVKYLGGTKVTSTEDIREYMSIRRDFIDCSLDFLRRNDYCIIIEAENGVLGFDQEGKEIYRNFDHPYDWKEEIVNICLKNLGITS